MFEDYKNCRTLQAFEPLMALNWLFCGCQKYETNFL